MSDGLTQDCLRLLMLNSRLLDYFRLCVCCLLKQLSRTQKDNILQKMLKLCQE
jgi:hypothetical protein